MTPAARVAAAIEVLDRVLTGVAAEPALTQWARANRYAGSGDRAAIRDWVFSALRRKRSAALMGGAMTGRGLALGLARQWGLDLDAVFSGATYAPAPLAPSERVTLSFDELALADRLDCPDWLIPRFEASLGDAAVPSLLAFRDRAPVFLRVNLRRGSVAEAMEELAGDGILSEPVSLVKTGLKVTENERRIAASKAFADGFVEVMDVASQAVIAGLPVPESGAILDYCAGGGGKSLALADRTDARILAHDIDARRMKDVAPRAARAGVKIAEVTRAGINAEAPFDMVLCDVPCSGSGTWRRTPEAKWALTPERLDELCRIQHGILRETHDLVKAGGVLVYVTCSLLNEENQDQIEDFLRGNAGFSKHGQRQFLPAEGGDGLFVSILVKK